MRICKHIGCELVHYGNGYCERHNRQFKKYGYTWDRSQREKNNITLFGEFAEIDLYNRRGCIIGKAIIDSKNIYKIKDYKWSLAKGYAVTKIKNKSVNLYRMIMDSDSEIDHIDRDKLNYREKNLRVCNRSENVWNEGISKNNTSGYKGVSFDKRYKKWAAYITIKRRRYHLGYFKDKISAAMKYNEAAEKAFGDFAYLNTNNRPGGMVREVI